MGLSWNVIADRVNITPRQVKYSLYSGNLSPKKSCDLLSTLIIGKFDELESFICLFRANHQLLNWPYLCWGLGEKAISSVLKKRAIPGIQLGKTLLSQRDIREYLSGEQKKTFLSMWNNEWSDEIYMNDGRHRWQRVASKVIFIF